MKYLKLKIPIEYNNISCTKCNRGYEIIDTIEKNEKQNIFKCLNCGEVILIFPKKEIRKLSEKQSNKFIKNHKKLTSKKTRVKDLRCSKCGEKLEHCFGKYLRCKECHYISEYGLTIIRRIKRKLNLLKI